MTSGKTSEYISSPRVSPIAHLNVNHKRVSEDTTTEEMVNAFDQNKKKDQMIIVENEDQAVRLLNKDESYAKNNKFEYPTVRDRKMKEKKLRPIG